ncbi:MAG: phosphatidylglycerophosphatase A [Proteobacteria bacterium]|nr:phosphatidylglycerophosphatase A [Pseudomonadota bacterium]
MNAQQWKERFKDWSAIFFASGFGSGFIPLAPGTWGSAVGVALVWKFWGNSVLVQFLWVLLLGALGVWASGVTCQYFKKQDCQYIVIDEIVGLMITMIGIPITGYELVIGFLLFRLFDVVKPVPVNWVDKKLKNGLGVMLDDVVAGVYGNLIMHLILRARL